MGTRSFGAGGHKYEYKYTDSLNTKVQIPSDADNKKHIAERFNFND